MSTHILITEYCDKIKCFGDLYLGRESAEKLAEMLNESVLTIDKADKELSKKANQREKQLPGNVKLEIKSFVYEFNFTKSALIGFTNGSTPAYGSFEAMVTSLPAMYVPIKNMNKQIKAKEARERLSKLNLKNHVKDLKERSKSWHEVLDTLSKGICYSYENHFQRVYAIMLDVALRGYRIRICPHCGKFFIIKSGKKVYCSDKCKAADKNKRMQARRKDGIYKEAEAIANIYRNRLYTQKYNPHDPGYIKIKKKEAREKILAEFEEYMAWKNKLIEDFRADRISEEECLKQLKERHVTIKRNK